MILFLENCGTKEGIDIYISFVSKIVTIFWDYYDDKYKLLK